MTWWTFLSGKSLGDDVRGLALLLLPCSLACVTLISLDGRCVSPQEPGPEQVLHWSER